MIEDLLFVEQDVKIDTSRPFLNRFLPSQRVLDVLQSIQ